MSPTFHKVARAIVVLISLGMIVLQLVRPDLVPHVVALGEDVVAIIGVLFVHKLGAEGQSDLAAVKGALGAPKVPRIPPMPVLLLGVFVFASGVTLGASHVSDTAERVSADVVAVAPVACNATSQQVQTTVEDGAKVAACVLGVVLGGQTDPLQIGKQCWDAAPAFIVAIIDDFTAQKATADGGLAMLASSVTDPQRANLAQAKQNAMAKLAAASKSP